MSQDVVVNQKQPLADFKAPHRIVPTYLIVLDAGTIKGTTVFGYFLATKFDDPAGGNYAKCVGLHLGNIPLDQLDNTIASYDTILKDALPENFLEVLFPWNKIMNVRSLTYRHKTQQQTK